MLFVPLQQIIPVAGDEEGGEERSKRIFQQWDSLGVPQTMGIAIARAIVCMCMA